MQEHSEYWRRISNPSPPESWTRVLVPSHGGYVLTPTVDWLRACESEGMWSWRGAIHLPEFDGRAKDKDVVFAISDPDVAFAFKMRFG